MKSAVILTVYGKVQGVGFRYYTKKKADELNISGIVKNKPNGTVYIEAEGDISELKTFIDWCEIGPEWARVSKIEKQSVPPLDIDSFNIK